MGLCDTKPVSTSDRFGHTSLCPEYMNASLVPMRTSNSCTKMVWLCTTYITGSTSCSVPLAGISGERVDGRKKCFTHSWEEEVLASLIPGPRVGVDWSS